MKRLVIAMLVLILTSGVTFTSAFAAGGKNHGSNGQGATGSTGKGAVTQTRGR